MVFVVPRLMPTDPVQQTLQRITIQGAFLDPDAIDQLRETLEDLYGQRRVSQSVSHLLARLFKGISVHLLPSFPLL